MKGDEVVEGREDRADHPLFIHQWGQRYACFLDLFDCVVGYGSDVRDAFNVFPKYRRDEEVVEEFRIDFSAMLYPDEIGILGVKRPVIRDYVRCSD